ncbi:hypothetical protein M8C21_002307 [Ambrosia artemisiifolia]|uniref:Uncharacterized protein n=1 Tax=Ambrosia artemisiifolia TaxID=4212 RepID=A0AAD5GP46_AMBAR|nr:hypothetical protein M8C21_002307 [Ambrosia artemisiifolia]
MITLIVSNYIQLNGRSFKGHHTHLFPDQIPVTGEPTQHRGNHDSAIKTLGFHRTVVVCKRKSKRSAKI